MTEQTSESLRAWFRRIEPWYPELFNTAHVICGNYERAEYALRSAILDVWSQNADGGMGFREKLRGSVREEALLSLREEGDGAELTWPGFTAGEDALTRQAARERPEVQRMLMLRYGVGLPARRVAQVTGATHAQVRASLDRFESRCRRTLSSQERARFTAMFTEAAQRQLGTRAGIPQPSAVYRAFEAEATGMQVSEHRVSRIVYRVLVLAMCLVCAALFWLFAVLVQTPQIKADPVPAPQATLVPEPQADQGPQIETTYQTEAPA